MRRRLFNVALLVLAGAAMNVAVAWVLALTVDLHAMEPVTIGARTLGGFYRDARFTRFEGWMLVVREAAGGRMVSIVPEDVRIARRAAASPDLVPHEAAVAYRRLGPYCDRPINMGPSGPAWNALVDEARGWPMLALCCQAEYESMRESTTLLSAGIKVSKGTGALGQATVLPLRPAWPGFAVNSLFYAGLLCLLVAVMRTVRGFIRVRRGHCPACGYPVGASPVCTECGRNLPARAAV